MKKYVITEEQLKVIVEKFDKNIPDDELKDTPALSFNDFLEKIDADAQNPNNQNPTDKETNVKSFVTATSAGNRADYHLDNADSHLKAIAGKFYKNMNSSAYRLNPDDRVLSDAEDLAIIIMSMGYYYYREGLINNFKVNDVKLNWRKNYDELKRTNLADIRGLLRTKFDSDLIGHQNQNDPDEIIITPKGNQPSFEVYVDKPSKKTKLVMFNFFDSASLSFFYKDFISKQQNIDLIQRAINRRFTAKVDSGKLVFKF